MKEELKQIQDENAKLKAEKKATLADLEKIHTEADAEVRKNRREEKNDTAKLRRELTLKEAEKTSAMGEVRRPCALMLLRRRCSFVHTTGLLRCF